MQWVISFKSDSFSLKVMYILVKVDMLFFTRFKMGVLFILPRADLWVLFDFTAAGVKCHVATVKGLPVVYLS